MSRAAHRVVFAANPVWTLQGSAEEHMGSNEAPCITEGTLPALTDRSVGGTSADTRDGSPARSNS